MIARSSRAPGGPSIALRTRWTRRSELVTVPSVSAQAAVAGRTTSASSAVLVRKMSWTTRKSRPGEQPDRSLLVGLRLDGVLADAVDRRQVAALHRVEHPGQVPAALRRDRDAPFGIELRPQLVVLDVLEARQPVGERAHVAAALDVVLATQRVDAAAVATDVPGQQDQVDEGEDVVDRVVVLGDPERPADHRPRRGRERVRQLADGLAPGRRSPSRRTRGCTARPWPCRPRSPTVARSMNSRFSRPAAMISRPMALARAMSLPDVEAEPARRPTRPMSVRRGSTAYRRAPFRTPLSR